MQETWVQSLGLEDPLEKEMWKNVRRGLLGRDVFQFCCNTDPFVMKKRYRPSNPFNDKSEAWGKGSYISQWLINLLE